MHTSWKLTNVNGCNCLIRHFWCSCYPKPVKFHLKILPIFMAKHGWGMVLYWKTDSLATFVMCNLVLWQQVLKERYNDCQLTHGYQEPCFQGSSIMKNSPQQNIILHIIHNRLALNGKWKELYPSTQCPKKDGCIAIRNMLQPMISYILIAVSLIHCNPHSSLIADMSSGDITGRTLLSPPAKSFFESLLTSPVAWANSSPAPQPR